jgi:hypothetical protein
MQYVESMTSVLSDHLGWHLARLKFMARFTSALLKLTTTNLREIAVAEGRRQGRVKLPADPPLSFEL